MAGVGITGGEQLGALGARMTATSLRADLQAALLGVAPHLVTSARASARENLPKAGGLNERIAADEFKIADRSTVLQAGVRISTAKSETRNLNYGTWRRPVFGHRDRFVPQTYAPAIGWFDNAMDAGRPVVEVAVTAVMVKQAAEITERL